MGDGRAEQPHGQKNKRERDPTHDYTVAAAGECHQ